MKEVLKSKLARAHASLEEAEALLAEGAELNFVMNSLYYAFLYPVFGLLQARNIPASLQSTAISLFEREFVGNGEFEKRFFDAIQRAFELRPACACEGNRKASKQEVEQLLPVAREFLKRVEQIAA